MSDIAIRVENLSKKYKIGANQARYQTLRESIVNGFSNSIERIKGTQPKDNNIIWALKDINFEIKHGEVLGIIGRNGAGKSTLLKILSRITKPTTGRFELNGRVGSLLEVGTGFHPELTGRENIYLSGAILGMKRKEINRKFDEIVDFAEIEKFLDTPVKHYSSGMYMRLAFSVAAYLEPEILLVDEVLAVGDISFQKKCLGKMSDVANEGRTILFVSHNMNSISLLCPKSILLKTGIIQQCDDSELVINSYLESSKNKLFSSYIFDYREKWITNPVIKEIIINNLVAPCELVIPNKSNLSIKLKINSKNQTLRDFRAGIHVYDNEGTKILLYSTPWSNLGFFDVNGNIELTCDINHFPLIPGQYKLSFGVSIAGQQIDKISNICFITIQPNKDENISIFPTYKKDGYFWGASNWNLKKLN